MDEAVQTYTLHTDGNGRVKGRCWTNDDEDLGQPSTTAQWPVSYANREQAIKITGGTHFGISGVKVTVMLDGQLIDHQGKAMP